MHLSSFEKMNAFVDTYLVDYLDKPLKILEVGSKVIPPQSSQKILFNKKNWEYHGLDIESGENVDIIPKNPYDWKEIKNNNYDIVISSQTFEHIPYFWVTAFEIGRILKLGGLCIIIAPSAGTEHRFPYDTFRYFPDGLIKLAEHMNFKIIESYVQYEDLYYEDGSDYNKDCCIIMQKPFFSEEENKEFLMKNIIYKKLINNEQTIFNNINLKIGYKNNNSIICKQNNKNCFFQHHYFRKSKINKFLLKYKKIKATIPIIFKAFLGEKLANLIFKIYPKMAKWN